MLSNALSQLYHNYRMFLGAVGIGVMMAGAAYTLLHMPKIPSNQRVAYGMMALYCAAAAAGGGVLLMHYGH